MVVGSSEEETLVFTAMKRGRCVTDQVIPVLISGLLLLAPTRSDAQDCRDTSEGRICRIPQAITNGDRVKLDDQRQRGLVIVNGGCSGTLLNRYWALTARHCVQQNSSILHDPPLLDPQLVTVTSFWSPGRVARVSAYQELPNASVDMILLYLGAADLGAVNTQRIYATTIDRGNGSVVLSGRLTTADSVTQYGRGFVSFASGVWNTASQVLARPADTYFSANFTPSNIRTDSYDLKMNARNQVGNGGDSGGPTIVNSGGFEAGIAGVQSTCHATGYLMNSSGVSAPPAWRFATGIDYCSYVATEPHMVAIHNAIGRVPPIATSLLQRHAQGRIWTYDGVARCDEAGCRGWTEIDRNGDTAEVIAARFATVQRHADGKIYLHDGKGRCDATGCPGWILIDDNRDTSAIVGGANGLYQRHKQGRIWRYDGLGRCNGTTCPGWTEIDRNGDTREVVVAIGSVFQRHASGALWRHDGQSVCSAAGCPGWILVDRNPATTAIFGAEDGFYQRHADGRLWKYDGTGACDAGGCPGWTLIDHNPDTAEVVASGGQLYQRHADGQIWKYIGSGPCGSDPCPGWLLIDHNPDTVQLAAFGTQLFQRHRTGVLWRYDGTSYCSSSGCPGWIPIDRNTDTAAIITVDSP